MNVGLTMQESAIVELNRRVLRLEKIFGFEVKMQTNKNGKANYMTMAAAKSAGTAEQVGGVKSIPVDGDFKNLVDLLGVYSEAQNRLTTLEAEANAEQMEVIDGLKSEYAVLQEALTKAETALEVIARKNRQWFAAKKTLKTPYGSVKLAENPPKIVSENPELSIVLIEQAAEKDAAFKNFLREEKALNLETLSACTLEQLAQFRLKRVKGDTFSVTAAKLDLGKAVKEAADDGGKAA